MNQNSPFKEKARHNWGWKLASVVLSTLLWLIITNYNDPVVTVRFSNIPVTILNDSSITSKGQVYEILENTDIIPIVTITASRSVAESFTRDDITATADLEEVTSRDMVPIHITLSKNNSEVKNVHGSIEDVKLAIEDSRTRTISLEVNTEGSLSDGYITGDISPSQNLVRVSGFASKIDTIDKAVANVDITGFTSDISTETDIILYDKDGNVVNDSGIKQNISTVSVNIEILKAKLVKVRLEYTGTPADGYVVSKDPKIEPETVYIAGRNADISNVNEIVISGGERFDITQMTENFSTKVDIRQFLPNGITLVNENGNIYTVLIGIDRIVEAAYEVHVSKLNITNMPEAAVYTPDTENINVSLKGLSDVMDKLTADNITMSLDLEPLLKNYEGNYPERLTATVQVNVPEGVSVVEAPEITLTLKK